MALPSTSKLRLPGEVLSGPESALAQVDHPFTGLDPPAQLRGVGVLGGCQVDRAGALLVGRSHVLVVGGERVQAGQHLGDELVLVEQRGRVGRGLGGDRGLHAHGGRGAAERSEAVGREHPGCVVHVGHELAHRVPLVVGQALGRVGADQVGAAHAAEQQRSAGEHRLVGALDAQGVGHVVRRVPGGVQHPPGHVIGAEPVPVADGERVEGVVVALGDHVGGAQLCRQDQAAGHVVVVDVCLDDVAGAPAALGQHGQDPVDVALGVHHDRGGAGGRRCRSGLPARGSR